MLRVLEHEPPQLLAMRSVAGPFPMHLTYRFDAHPDGTLASIEARGDYRLVAPVIRLFVRSSLRRDLRDLARNLS